MKITLATSANIVRCSISASSTFNMSAFNLLNPDCHQREQSTQIPMLAFLERALQSGRWLWAIAGVFLLVLFPACETTVSTRLPQEAVAQAVTLSPGDVVRITFAGAPDLNQTQKIQADGKINLPMVGQVEATGKTVANLQQELEALYKSQLQNANVVVTLDTSLMPVVVAGAVTKPAKYFFDRPTTILQAVMEAGGANQFGTLGKVSVIRIVDGQQRTEMMDLRPILRGLAMKPVYVRAGDVIVVGESSF